MIRNFEYFKTWRVLRVFDMRFGFLLKILLISCGRLRPLPRTCLLLARFLNERLEPHCLVQRCGVIIASHFLETAGLRLWFWWSASLSRYSPSSLMVVIQCHSPFSTEWMVMVVFNWFTIKYWWGLIRGPAMLGRGFHPSPPSRIYEAWNPTGGGWGVESSNLVELHQLCWHFLSNFSLKLSKLILNSGTITTLEHPISQLSATRHSASQLSIAILGCFWLLICLLNITWLILVVYVFVDHFKPLS